MFKVFAFSTTGSSAKAISVAHQQFVQRGLSSLKSLRKRLVLVNVILTFLLLALALESRRHGRRHRLSRILWNLYLKVQRFIWPWQERLVRLQGLNAGSRLLWASTGKCKAFSCVFFWGGAEDEDGGLKASLSTGDGDGGQCTRKVVLGDRGRARCSWMVRQQFLRRAYCDVSFVVEGKTFPAHRCWVAAFSLPLCAMFNSGMRESQESCILLRDTDAGAFELMLNFIYGGPVELNQDNIESVLELSVRFAVGMLMEQCCNFLASAVAVDTACAILILADRYDCRPLRRDTLLFLVAHLPQCWAAAKGHVARLPRHLLLEVLSHDGLDHGEIVAFRAAVYWLEEWRRTRPVEQDEAEKEEEEALVEEVLGQVRFPYMPAALLAEEVECHPIMQAEACQRFILEAYRYQAISQRGQLARPVQLGAGDGGRPRFEGQRSQGLVHKYAEGMGVRARPRRKLIHDKRDDECDLLVSEKGLASRRVYGGGHHLEMEEKWGEELLLPGGAGTLVNRHATSTAADHPVVCRLEDLALRAARSEEGSERERVVLPDSLACADTTNAPRIKHGLEEMSNRRVERLSGSSKNLSSTVI